MGEDRSSSMPVAELATRLEHESVLLLDIRPAEDVAAGHIPGSWPVPLAVLADRLSDPGEALHQRLQRSGTPVAVVAGTTERFTAAADILSAHDISAVAVPGEITAWSDAGLPVNRGNTH